jgi:hypothetical protein
MRIYVHHMLYRTSINLFGTEEQVAKLMPDVEAYNVIGCFAMTEMGHRFVFLKPKEIQSNKLKSLSIALLSAIWKPRPLWIQTQTNG